MEECFTRSRSILCHFNETRETCVSRIKVIDIKYLMNYNKHIYLYSIDYIAYRAFPAIVL